MNDKMSLANGGVYHPASKPAESAYCRHGGQGSYEQPSKHNCKEDCLVDFCEIRETIPGFNQHLPAKYFIFLLIFSVEHYQYLENAVTNIGQHYLKVKLFHTES
jgi:hypothetical protein